MNDCFYCHKAMRPKEKVELKDGRVGHGRCVIKYIRAHSSFRPQGSVADLDIT